MAYERWEKDVKFSDDVHTHRGRPAMHGLGREWREEM
jgi:hypothetical protein